MNLLLPSPPEEDRRFSGMAQLALLMSLYPVIMSFSLLDLLGRATTPEIFPIGLRYLDDDSLRIDFDFGHLFEQPFRYFVYLVQTIPFYPIALVACIRRRLWGWLGFGLAVPHAILLVVLLELVFGRLTPVLDTDILVSGIAAKIAFAWFVLEGRIWSRSFLLFALLCLIPPLVSAADAGFLDTLNGLLPLLAFVLLVLLCRLLVMVVVQNAYIVRRLGAPASLRMLLRALLLWTPMLLLAAPYFILSAEIRTAIVDWAYARPEMVRLPGREPELRADTLWSVSRWFQAKADAWGRQAGAFEASLAGLPISRLSDMFGQEFDRTFEPELDFSGKRGPEMGGLAGWVAGIAATVSETTTNFAYVQVRNRARAKLVADVEALEPTLGRGVDLIGAGARKVRVIVTALLVEANRDVQLGLWWSFTYLHATHLIGHLLFLFLCIKSFLYVLSRVVFARQGGAFLTLGDTERDEAMPKGTLIRHGGGFEVTDEAAETFFVARRFQPQGKPPRLALPQPLRAPIARLLHRAMTMNRIDIRPGEGGARYSATRGAEFVEWRLAAGERVVFDFNDFVAMSGTVGIATLISARLTSVILGRLIFSTASGPGRLVLMTQGRPHASDTGPVGSLPPHRLVAWQESTRFEVASELGLVDIYLSTAYVEPIGDALLVVDVDRQDRSGSGLARFVRHFLLP